MFMPRVYQEGKGNTFTLLIIPIVKSIKKGNLAQIYNYDPQSARINVQSPQSKSTPKRLTLYYPHPPVCKENKNQIVKEGKKKAK